MTLTEILNRIINTKITNNKKASLDTKLVEFKKSLNANVGMLVANELNT
jgi:hypothetical protein